MNVRFRLQAVLVVVFVLITGSADGQHIFQMQAYSKPIEILVQNVFEARFGNNPHIPRSEEAIIALARRLYPTLATEAEPRVLAHREDWCGEEDVGLLFAALQNPAILDATRIQVDEIIAEAVPKFDSKMISDSGHFKIYYNRHHGNPRHNVKRAQIVSLAKHLDSYWDLYAQAREPKHKIVRGKARIDVKVYYIGPRTLGRTNSKWDHIELNSELCVRNPCDRRSVSGHELFHRLQYAYGYKSGTANMGWIVEGTAVWSQKLTNPDLGDYMYWMNRGLKWPDRALITSRKYDAAHFWVYLQEHYPPAIGDVWATYEENGNDAKAAVDSVTRDNLGMNFDDYAAMWSSTNYMKDLVNATRGAFNYEENDVFEVDCREEYGPLRRVPVTTTRAVNPRSSFTWFGFVYPYGADYFVFTPLRTSEGYVEVRLKGEGSYVLSLIGIRNDNWKRIVWDDVVVSTSFMEDVSDWDKIVVVVMGTTKGGEYRLSVIDTSIPH